MSEQDPRESPSARVGRKYGRLSGRSQEYDALARFLRDRVTEAGLTVKSLTAATGLKKSAISERLAGNKLDAEFIDSVVLACTEEGGLRPKRERKLQEARRLLLAAQQRSTPIVDLARHPPSVKNVVEDAQAIALEAQSKLLDVHEELARKGDELVRLTRVQQQSQLALRDANALFSVLSIWVVVLADEVEQLTRKRELTMVAQHPDLTRLSSVDAELARTIAHHGRTAAELARAEQEQRLAIALVAEALTRTRQVRHDVQRLRAAVQLPTEGEAAFEAEPEMLVGRLAAPNTFGDDIDAALDRAEAVGRTIAERLHDALVTLDEGAATVSLSATDNADNAVTGTDATDNAPADKLWWDLLVDVPSNAFAWAEEAAAALVRDRDPQDPRFRHIAAERPLREVMLLADRLQEHRWLEGAARLRIALALSLAPKELTSMILALTRAGRFMQREEQGAQLLRAALAGRKTSDVLAVHNLLANRDSDTPRLVRRALSAIAQRPYADVLALLRDQLMDNPRVLTHSALMEAIVREWPPEEVVSLVEQLMDIEDGDIGWWVFWALPTPPANQTELLVRLWNVLPHKYFSEALPVLYKEGDSSTLTTVLAALHAELPPPLDSAARGLAAEVMPLIIRRTTVETLDLVSEGLSRLGLSPVQIFEPYRDLLVPTFARPPGDAS
ncbi:coiled-coil domain-containing protein [Streptomyces violascens]|uniref:hypothetical protein n=1 Tax=Streptomyces violascens TaxID=67381 RepID=UPI0036CE7EA6